MAWLHAAPNPVGNEKTERKARIKTLAAGSPELSLPEVEGCEYLTDAFMQSGMAMSNGMGATHLTWQELIAFNTVAHLDEWDLRQLMQMSKAYCSMLHKAEDRIPPPYMRELNDDEKAWIAQQQAAAFEALERQTAGIKSVKKTR